VVLLNAKVPTGKEAGKRKTTVCKEEVRPKDFKCLNFKG